MATTYVTKDAWHFQYALDNPSSRRTALLRQACSEQSTPWLEEDDATTYKIIFPGSTNDLSKLNQSFSDLLLETGDFLLLEIGDSILLE